jgi:tRNA A-37 threonylcarbamoyl transferase component Bud32
MNEKRIAVLVSGEYREFEIAHKSWEFINNPNVDFYFSTWEISKQKNPKLGIGVKENITEHDIRKYLPNCRNIDIGSELKLRISNKTNGQRMVNRWIKSIEMVQASGIDYDICIIIRPDLFLTYDSSLFYEWLDTIEDNCIYTLSDLSTLEYFVQDLILISSRKSITNLLKLPVSDLREQKDIHQWLGKELIKIFHQIRQITGIKCSDFSIVRPNSRNKPDINLTTIKKDAAKWYRSLYSNDTIIKEFSGFSGSKVLMIKSLSDFIIRKIDNVERNYEKLQILKENGFLVPSIIDKEDNVLDMEYIHGQDMKTFLKLENPRKLTEFIIDVITQFKNINAVSKDYTSIFENQLSFFSNDKKLPFSSDRLLERLPKVLPSSLCHGDFTMDNLIYKDPHFYMIDPSTGVYDSWVFDLAKLRQDLDAKWFLRNGDTTQFNLELSVIKQELQRVFPEAFDDYLYILMLLRVYKYSHDDTLEQRLLLEEIKRIWK